MKTSQLLVTALFLGGILFLSSCASVSGFHTGRVVEKNKGEIGGSLSLARTPDFSLENEDIPNVAIPILEIGGRYGITNKIDIGLRVNSSLNFLIDGKFQLVGDQESEFAMAIGAGFGAFAVPISSGTLLNFQVPIYTSFHPKENLHIYFAPRYIGQFAINSTESSELLNYMGGNVGVLFGTKTKFGIDLGLFKLQESGDGYSSELLNIGVGIIHKL